MKRLVRSVLDHFTDPADDLVILEHAEQILQSRGYTVTASAVAAVIQVERLPRSQAHPAGKENAAAAELLRANLLSPAPKAKAAAASPSNGR